MADTLVSSQAVAPKQNLKDRTFGFFGNVNKEMKKVTWPTREQLIDSTIVTLGLCALFSLFVFGVDKIFEIVLRLVYSF